MTPTSDAAPTAAPDPTHRCLRCGAAIALGEAMCAACNPAGLKQPAASQAHGTVFLGIALAVAGLAVAATFLVGGVGPFSAAIRAVVPDGEGLVLAVAVENAGSRSGRASCRVWDPTYMGSPPVETFIQSPAVGPGEELVFQQRVTGLGAAVRPLAISCTR